MSHNDIDLERLRETEIALRFANMGFEKCKCEKCGGCRIDQARYTEYRAYIEALPKEERYYIRISNSDFECVECVGTGYVWKKKEGEINAIPTL